MRDASEEAKVIQNVMPALRITDYTGSMAFHLYGLGFRVVWEHRLDPYPLVFAQITRAGLTFYLAELFRDCQVGGLFHFFASNVDEWHGELLSKGVPVSEPPSEIIEGLRNMPVGNPMATRSASARCLPPPNR